MNALNLLSGRSSANPTRSRTSSLSDIHASSLTSEEVDTNTLSSGSGVEDTFSGDEKTPLLHGQDRPERTSGRKSWRLFPQKVTDIVATSFRVIITTITAPARYLVACFYDENGRFSAILPIRLIFRVPGRRRRRKQSVASHVSQRQHDLRGNDVPAQDRIGGPQDEKGERESNTARDIGSLRQDRGFVAQNTDDQPQLSEKPSDDSPASNTRSKTAAHEESAPAKRSIRIKLHNETGQKRRHRSARSVDESGTEDDRLAAVANSLKSPSSPVSTAKVRYPRAPAPPRPLVPRRQPSYTTVFNSETPKKTLVIDLDETLIHSMAKGGRMSTGHMVEVKFQGPVGGNGVLLGPQVPILYFVHERPHCHEFLRKVSKWYNLVAFTASVQEYADPVVDWLERERRYFSARYYRQHCTFRNGAYIKDLSHVEPDLSRVMILDNSPMSYIFHEDNAIPIEGWISDPTDSDLLHLVPLLEGLQYATDVRALLALRLGQIERP